MVVGPDHMVNATEAYTADGNVQRKTRPIEIGGVKTVADIGLNASSRKGNTTKVTPGAHRSLGDTIARSYDVSHRTMTIPRLVA